jgi:hypothetical protein
MPPDWVGVAKDGQYCAVQWKKELPRSAELGAVGHGLWAYHIESGRGRPITKHHNHGCLGMAYRNNRFEPCFWTWEKWYSTNNNIPGIFVYFLNDGFGKPLRPVDWVVPQHFSGHRDGYCLISSGSYSAGVPLSGEIWAIGSDGESFRMAHHYGSASGGYWTLPMACISESGNYALCGTNWLDTQAAGVGLLLSSE